MKPLRIAYVAYYDPMDISQWSGIGYHMHRALEEAGAEVTLVGPLKKLYHPLNAFKYLWNTKVRGYKDHPQRDKGFLRYYAKQVERIVADLDVDIVLGPGGLPLAYANLDKPMAVWTDATWANLIDYYDAFTNVSPRSIRDGHAGEKALLDRCYRAIFSSRWAADSARDVYGCPEHKLEVIGLGANVPDQRSRDEIERVVEARSRDELRLLFLGVQWHRKGGDIAIAVGEELHKRGLPVRLDLVGAAPDPGTAVPGFANEVGFIKKSTPEGMARIASLLDESHFMLLPTRADCTPIVFNEASSAGLPVMTTRTGGVPTVVREGTNGYLFDIDANPSEWADRIEQLWNDRDAYRTLCLDAWRDFHERLTWKATAEHAVRYLTQAVEDHKAGRP